MPSVPWCSSTVARTQRDQDLARRRQDEPNGKGEGRFGAKDNLGEGTEGTQLLHRLLTVTTSLEGVSHQHANLPRTEANPLLPRGDRPQNVSTRCTSGSAVHDTADANNGGI